jgi:hypothetical protein
MSNYDTHKRKELTIATSQAADLADLLVAEPIDILELRIEANSAKGQQAQPAYALQRNQALTRGRSGYSNASLPQAKLNDATFGKGETSAQLIARRLS